MDPLILTVFPGDSGSTRIYDDAGNDLGYKRNQFTWTEVRHSRLADASLKIEIFPIKGRYPGMLTQRDYEIRLPLSWPPASVTANGIAVSSSRHEDAPGWRYDGDRTTTVISLPKFSVNTKVEVLVKVSAGLRQQAHLLDVVPGRLSRLHHAYDILNSSWPKGWSPDILIDALQTGNRITLKPATARDELQKLERNTPELLKQIKDMPDVDSKLIDRALAHIGAGHP